MKKTSLLISSLLFFAFIAKAQQTVVTFNYTGAVQTFVVPSCVTSITIDASGAAGGQTTTNAIGGLGGRTQCTLPVTPGETLQINVGGAGINGDNITGLIAGGFNGGGNGWDDTDPWGGAGGGGASDIRRTPYSLNDRVVVGGRGGGGGIDGCNSANLLTGGVGGGLTGGDGAPSPSSCVGSGTGGSQIAGGLKGQYPSCANNSFDGVFGIGGSGYGACSNSDDGGSGGGGGYYGGGSGNFGAGGGGSSYTDVSCTGVFHTQGTQNGNGILSITYTPGVNAVATADQSTICTGGQTNLQASGGQSYSWSPASSLSCSTCQNPVASPTATTCYTVTVTDISFCTGTAVVCVTVQSCTGIFESQNINDVQVFPNPFNEALSIRLNGMNEAEIIIYNVMGEKVFVTSANSDSIEISTSEFTPGIYFVNVRSSDQSITKKLVKVN